MCLGNEGASEKIYETVELKVWRFCCHEDGACLVICPRV